MAYRREPRMSPNVKETKDHVETSNLSQYLTQIEADDKAHRVKGFHALWVLFSQITDDDAATTESNLARFTESAHTAVVAAATKALKGSFADEQDAALRAATSAIVFGFPATELEAEWIANVVSFLSESSASNYSADIIEGLVQSLYVCSTAQMLRLKDAKERSVSAQPLIDTLQSETCSAESAAALLLGTTLVAKLEEIDDVVALLEGAMMDQTNSDVLLTLITAIGVLYERFRNDTTLSTRIFSRFEAQSAKVMGRASTADVRAAIRTVSEFMEGAELPSYEIEIPVGHGNKETVTASFHGFQAVEQLKALRTFAEGHLEEMLKYHRFVRRILNQEGLASSVDPLSSWITTGGLDDEREKKRHVKEHEQDIDRARKHKEERDE